jgi:hypothetical protein
MCSHTCSYRVEASAQQRSRMSAALSSKRGAAHDTMRAHLSQMAGATAELEELREMKEDVERRERAQAAVIENQAKRLEELETLYKVPSHALRASPFTACYQLAAHTVMEQLFCPKHRMAIILLLHALH